MRSDSIYIRLGLLALLFAVLMSIPFLLPGCGLFALAGLVPLLFMEELASQAHVKRFWLWHYSAFLLWNLVTTFWVCNATVGGGLFASFANAFQMSLVFGLFRWSKKMMRGSLPYIFLAAAWIAWERYYLLIAQISWPWLLLGNSFARTTWAAQWYEYTGATGGSLWVWMCNLSLYALLSSVLSGRWKALSSRVRIASAVGICLVFLFPAAVSLKLWYGFEETSDPVKVMIVQPNIDPYNKFSAMTQDQQDALLEGLAARELSSGSFRPDILIAPETFTGDIVTNDIPASRTYGHFLSFIREHGIPSMLFGASARTFIGSGPRPSKTARFIRDGVWMESHNVAIMLDSTAKGDIYYKSKLVVGVEMMPYPSLFRPLDEALGGVMGRCIGQDKPSVLRAGDAPFGVAVCYESVYPEWCAGYVKAGAQVLSVITNDAWWGDTPGYRQHCSYASLRAIETRRDIARCANTGISCIINQRGDIVEKTSWWEPAVICGEVNLNTRETFFVRTGDFVGRICVLVFFLLLLWLVSRSFIPKSLR